MAFAIFCTWEKYPYQLFYLTCNHVIIHQDLPLILNVIHHLSFEHHDSPLEFRPHSLKALPRQCNHANLGL